MAYVYSSLGKKLQDNAPGTKKRVFVAPRRLITSLAAPAATGTGNGDTIEITGNHTFGASDGFIELYTTMDTSELTAETVGDRDSRSLNAKLECFHPGLYKEVMEFANWVKDDEFIVLVEMLDGTVIQLGSDGLECDITAKHGSGKVSGGGKGTTFTVEAFGPIYIYSGTITMKP